MRTMRKYLKVFDIGLQNTFVYRWNFFLRSLFGLFPLLDLGEERRDARPDRRGPLARGTPADERCGSALLDHIQW